jgi:hypothetical protein
MDTDFSACGRAQSFYYASHQVIRMGQLDPLPEGSQMREAATDPLVIAKEMNCKLATYSLQFPLTKKMGANSEY